MGDKEQRQKRRGLRMGDKVQRRERVGQRTLDRDQRRWAEAWVTWEERKNSETHVMCRNDSLACSASE
jgi:hypothetical protein